MTKSSCTWVPSGTSSFVDFGAGFDYNAAIQKCKIRENFEIGQNPDSKIRDFTVDEFDDPRGMETLLQHVMDGREIDRRTDGDSIDPLRPSLTKPGGFDEISEFWISYESPWWCQKPSIP